MNPLTFRRWRNKSYAVFSSLHQVIRIGTLSVAYSLICLPVLHAQADTLLPEKKIELEEVELLADAPPQILAGGGSPVLVINKEDISSSGAQSLAGLLEMVPQIDIRQRGSFGVQADLTLRGSTFDQVMILINGINLTDPQTGHFNLNIPFDLSLIQRIEIIRGPVANFYGANGYTGAINIITGPDTSSFISTTTAFGSFRRWEASATVNLHSSTTGFLSHLSSTGSEGYRENTDFLINRMFFQAEKKGKLFRGWAMAGLNRMNYGANSFYSLRYPDQYEEYNSSFAAFELSPVKLKIPLKLSGSERLSSDHFALVRNDPYFYQNYHRTLSLALDLKTAFESSAGYTRIGLGFKSDRIISTVLGEKLAEPLSIPGTDSLLYTRGDTRKEYHLSINHRKKIGQLKLSGGIYIYLNGLADNEPLFFPGLDLSYDLNTNWTLYGSLNRSLRLPTFTDLYYSGPQNEGNPKLEPERAWTAEAGAEKTFHAADLSLSAFYRSGRNTIDWVWMEDEKWHTMNYTSLMSYGSEVTFSVFPGKLKKPFPLVKKITLSWSYTMVRQLPSAYMSHYALDFLNNQAGLDFVLQPFHHLDITVNSRYQQRNGSYPEYDLNTGLTEEIPYRPFIISDLRFSYALKTMQFYIACGNLFNVSYMDIGGLPQPGRWVSLGIRVNLSKLHIPQHPEDERAEKHQ